MMETLAERCNIETMYDKTDEDWHARRLIGIGGSEASVLVPGANKYESELHLFGVKTGKIPHEVLDNEAIRLGHRLERPVVEEFAAHENRAIVEWPVSLQWREKPWMLANLDFLEVIPSEQFQAGKVTTWESAEPPPGILRIVEIKTSGLAGFGTAHQWFADGNETAPLAYQLQVLHYQIVSGIYDAVLVGLLAGHGITVREMPYDEVTAEGLIAIEENFWTHHVLEDFPPEPDGSESSESVLKEMWPRSVEGTSVELGSHLAELWSEFQMVKAEAEAAEKKRKEMRAKIVVLMKDADVGLADGEPICTYKSGAHPDWLDKAELEKAHPEIVKEFTKKRPGARTLRAAPKVKPKGVEA